MSSELLITRSTLLPLKTVCLRLAEAAASHKCGVLAVHNLREKMEANGVPFDRECRVIEVCSPQQAQIVLNQEIEIATALPCRIAVYQENERTILATMKPTMLLAMFNAPGAADAAQEVENMMVRLMDEACRG